MSDFILEVNDLSVRFGGVYALNGIDFKLRRNELRCLIGANGAGKSTFLKSLIGILKPSGGNIFFNNRDITGLPTHRIARLGVGIKTQVPSLMESLSVRENVWLAAYRAGGKNTDKMAENALREFGFRDDAAKQASKLSHGQRQLLELSLISFGRPSLILLDEPAAGMSPEDTGLLIEKIKKLQAVSALIVIDHDMRFINRIAETITVFHQGRFLIEGEKNVVLNDETVKNVYLGKE